MSRNYTGAAVRLCDCGDCQAGIDVPCLLVYEDAGEEFAHCNRCGRTWSVKTRQVVEQTGPHASSPAHHGRGRAF